MKILLRYCQSYILVKICLMQLIQKLSPQHILKRMTLLYNVQHERIIKCHKKLKSTEKVKQQYMHYEQKKIS